MHYKISWNLSKHLPKEKLNSMIYATINSGCVGTQVNLVYFPRKVFQEILKWAFTFPCVIRYYNSQLKLKGKFKPSHFRMAHKKKCNSVYSFEYSFRYVFNQYYYLRSKTFKSLRSKPSNFLSAFLEFSHRPLPIRTQVICKN